MQFWIHPDIEMRIGKWSKTNDRNQNVCDATKEIRKHRQKRRINEEKDEEETYSEIEMPAGLQVQRDAWSNGDGGP